MRGKCAYPDCLSGTAADRRCIKVYGLKKKTFFRVPRDQLRLKQWESALNRPLKDSEVICELHFDENDILSHYKIPLFDGSVFIMEKGQKVLSSTAVPHSYPPDSDKKNTGDYSTSQNIKNLPITDMHAKPSAAMNIDIVSVKKESIVADDYSTLQSIENLPVTDMQAGPSTVMNIDIFPVKEESNVVDNYLTTLQSNENLLVTNMHTKPSTAMNIDIFPVKEELNVADDYSTMLQSNENLSLTNMHARPSTAMTIDIVPVKKESNVARNFLSTWENIKHLLLPDKWTSMVFPNSVVIGIWRPDGQPAKRLVVKPDLTIQVFIENEAINLPGMTALNFAEDIMDYINTLQPLLLCQGRSYRQFPKQCLGFVDPKDTIRLRFGHFWCVHCRVTNRKIDQKTNIHKTVEAALQKKRQSQQIAKLERQRRKRMASKINELNEIIKILRRKCAIMQEELSRISKNKFQYYLPNNKKPFRHTEIDTSARSML